MNLGKTMSKILVLGIGNILQSDDGIGVHIINHILESGMEIPADVELIDGGTAGFDLLSIMTGREKIIIVDALRADDTPGSIYRFTPEHAAGSFITFSLHEVGIMKVIRTLSLLGEDPKIEFIGIVPEDISTLKIGISPEVEKSIPMAVDQIFNAVINVS